MESSEANSATSQKVTDDTGTIVVDVACRGCRYNLRGLSETGRCPECGGAIPESVKLHLARPRPESMKPYLAFALAGAVLLIAPFLLSALTFMPGESICSGIYLAALLLTAALLGSGNALLNRQRLHRGLAIATFVISVLCWLYLIGVSCLFALVF